MSLLDKYLKKKVFVWQNKKKRAASNVLIEETGTEKLLYELIMIILPWLFTICYFITAMSSDDMFKPENPLNFNDNLFSHDCDYFDFSNLPSTFYSANDLLVLHIKIGSLPKQARGNLFNNN